MSIIAASPTGRDFLNGKALLRHQLPLGHDHGGPLFFAHYSFLGLDPRGLKDRYADYWEQNVAHVRINREHCVAQSRRLQGLRRDLLGPDRQRRPGRLRRPCARQ